MRQTKPHKIIDDVLLNDVKEHPDDYQYERAWRLDCSRTGIYHALKRLRISKKKTLAHPKACPIKKSQYLSQLNTFIAKGFAIVYMDESGFVTAMLPLEPLASIATTGKQKNALM